MVYMESPFIFLEYASQLFVGGDFISKNFGANIQLSIPRCQAFGQLVSHVKKIIELFALIRNPNYI